MRIIQLKFFGSIRAAVGKDEDSVDICASSTVYELLRTLSGNYGGAFREEIFHPNGELRDDLTVTINGVIADHTSLEKAGITSGDVIALLPSFPGGG